MKTIDGVMVNGKVVLPAKKSKFTGIVNYELVLSPFLTETRFMAFSNGKQIPFTVKYECAECGCSKIVQEDYLKMFDKLPRNMKEIIKKDGHSEGSSCISYLKEQIMELKEIVDNHRYCMKSSPEVGSLAWDMGENENS